MSVRVEPGDMLEVIPRLVAEGVVCDACVTDPPYLLTEMTNRFGSESAAEAKYGADGAYKRLGAGFMGMRWDAPADGFGASPIEYWLAGFLAGEGCFRLQEHKGGKYFSCTMSVHLRRDDAAVLLGLQKRYGGSIRFGDSRTNKQGITSSADVRWVVQSRTDCWRLARSLDRVPMFAKKANDYALWRRGLELWTETEPGKRWGASRDVSEMASLYQRLQEVKRFDSDVDLSFDPFMPPSQAFHYQWAKHIYSILRPGGFLLAFGGTRTSHRMISAIEDAGFVIQDKLLWLYGSGFPKRRDMLKPAYEPICLAYKPGGARTMQVDECRIGTGESLNGGAYAGEHRQRDEYSSTDNAPGAVAFSRMNRGIGEFQQPQGRWPANIIHDGSDEVLACFPDSKAAYVDPQCAAAKLAEHKPTNQRGVTSFDDGKPVSSLYTDAGTAARFFYAAKAAAHDRWGSRHPTVKPVELIRYLVKLVCPPGGTFIDPFAGSGTAGVAALAEGRSAILIEREAEYLADIRERMAHYEGEGRHSLVSKNRKRAPAKPEGLFGHLPEAAE